jgi:hypothetical protein
VGGACSANGGEEEHIQINGRIAKRERPRHGCVDNVKVVLVEIGLSELDWIGLVQIGTGGELL